MKSFFDTVACESPILSLNVEETKKAYHVTLLAPGLNKKDISVFVSGKKVTITNKKQTNDAFKGTGTYVLHFYQKLYHLT